MIVPAIDFKELVVAGPEALEMKFDELIRMVKGGNMDLPSMKDDEDLFRRYETCDEILDEMGHDESDEWYQFVRAFFLQQAGGFSSNEPTQLNYFKLAIDGYQYFLDPQYGHLGDVAYFAQWQIGNLQKALGMDWYKVEELYRQAAKYDAERGEAMREIILYYASEPLYGMVYSYTSQYLDTFLGKIPANKLWFINPAFYRWKILKYHIPAVVEVHKKDELTSAYNRLMELYNANRDQFDEEETFHVKRLINKYEKAMSEK